MEFGKTQKSRCGADGHRPSAIRGRGWRSYERAVEPTPVIARRKRRPMENACRTAVGPDPLAEDPTKRNTPIASGWPPSLAVF
jgi:hypothetical protein